MNECVTITKNEYEQLIRDNEKVTILTQIVKCSEYVTPKEIKAILGIAESEGE